jgi:hypothetical protein
MKPKTFERWCEDNGRRWTGCRDADEFFKNAVDYEAYRDGFYVDDPGRLRGNPFPPHFTHQDFKDAVATGDDNETP